MLHKSSKLVVKNYDDTARTVKGYASVFDNIDSDADRLKKGAFNKSIKEWGPNGKNRIKVCLHHDMNRPVAVIKEMYEDDKGLYMEAKFGTSSSAEDAYRDVKDGILTEFSIGFVPTQKTENDFGGRDFNQVKLYEVSLVTVAANDKALVTDVKSATYGVEIIDGMLKLLSKLEDSDAAFKIEKDLQRLKSIAEETATEAASKEEALEQEVKAKEEEVELLTQLKQQF